MNLQSLPLIAHLMRAIIGQVPETVYENPSVYVYQTVEDVTHILEYKYDKLAYKAGIGQKLGGQK